MEGVGNTPESKPTPSAPASVQPPQATPVAPSASQELLKQTLASYDGKKKLAYEWNADDDNSDDGESPSASKTAVQTEELVNLVCPACHGQEVQKLENTNQEDGSLVECLTCGCFFSL
jgi:hypothetical protein